MNGRSVRNAWMILLLSAAAGAGQGPLVGDDDPLLRLEAGGPTTLVTALAFGPDGGTLYEGGWDKIVRVWTRDPKTGAFAVDERAAYRVPIGPGLDGAINAVALSSDGTWLAVAGKGVIRNASGFRRSGLIVPPGAMSDEMRLDQGTITIFNTRTSPRTVRLLRGHLGPVRSLAFAPARGDDPPVLVSVAQERDRTGVVRLWDVSRSEYLGGVADLPNPVPLVPALAIWRTGPLARQVRVALAWGDGILRLWDPARNRLVQADDGSFNNTVAYLADRATLVTGSFDPRAGHGQIRTWEIPPGDAPRLVEGRRASLIPAGPGPAGRQEYIPRTLALIPARAGQGADRLAVVLRRVGAQGAAAIGGDEYSLQLVDVRPDTFGAVEARISLWKGDGDHPAQPALAISPTGDRLAVAGHPDREILVGSTDDAIQGLKTAQRLRADGTTSRRVAFVKSGADWGLLLGEANAAGDLVFDATRRRLTADRAGWRVVAPDLGGWRAGVSPEGRDPQGRAVPGSVWVRQGDGPERRIGLKAGQVVSAVALLPPIGPRRVPIVAIAAHDLGQPFLGLHDGASGAQVRQLTGHVERVRGLAFSDDGRLLASASDDRTVCVWSLTDLDATLGKRGQLPEVAVTEARGGLVVTVGTENGLLRAGDAIVGLVERGRLRPLATLLDYYNTLSLAEPGRAVTLRRVRGREGPRDAVLQVAQGIDERKPLLSLFVTRGDRPEDRAWIGWSPLGPYESSGRDVERLLGWHFNTGRPDVPTRFAMADQYRKFYREGLLRDLLNRGTLPPLPPPRPLPRPDLSLVIDPDGEPDSAGQLVVHRPPATLSLVVLDRRLPADQVESVQWSIDGSPPRPLQPGADRIWSADLAGFAWGAGVHKIQAVVRTIEATPQEFVETRLVRFQPAPGDRVEAGPKVEDRPRVPEVVDLAIAPEDLVIEPGRGRGVPTARLRARLVYPRDRRPFRAAVLVNGEVQPEPPAIDEQAATLTAEVPLRPGENPIQVRLSNEWNSTWVTEPVSVTFRRPPRVASVERPEVGASPLVVVTARVESPDDLPLTHARIIVNGEGRVIDDLILRKDGDLWTVSASGVPIDPGANRIEVIAWNRDGPSPVPGVIEGLAYNAPPPPRPEVEFLSPGRDSTVGSALQTVAFLVRSPTPMAKVELVRERSAGERQVLFAADPAQIHPDDQGVYEFRAAPAVTLAHRENILKVVAINAGGERAVGLTLSYVPPPVRLVVDRIEPKASRGKALVPVVREDNRIEFADPSTEGAVQLVGRVIWPDKESTRAERVQVWINGFPHRSADLTPIPGKPLEREFRADLTLSRRENEIELKLPGLAREADDRPRFQLSCLHPEVQQRLHLLVIGVGQEDEDLLRQRALHALQGRLDPGSTVAFQTPAFPEGWIYGPLSGDVRKSKLTFQLNRIKYAIDPARASARAATEVVVIYYQGGERIDKGESYLRLRNGHGRDDRDVIAVRELAEFFAGAAGAQIFLLDVTRPPTDAPAPLADPSRVGLLRFAWNDDADVSPGETPNEARLITALEQSIPNAFTLEDLASNLSQKHLELSKHFPNLSYERDLPDPLASLIVGRP